MKVDKKLMQKGREIRPEFLELAYHESTIQKGSFREFLEASADCRFNRSILKGVAYSLAISAGIASVYVALGRDVPYFTAFIPPVGVKFSSMLYNVKRESILARYKSVRERAVEQGRIKISQLEAE
jgi:hypothetical protein